jgi:[CysO sulfur-carrier protein]-S-L-cysteine hydrolase
LKLIYKHNNIKLIVEKDLLEDMGSLGVQYFPNEFGGFLIGNYSEDFKTLYITDYILPKKYKAYPYLFHRYIDGLKSIFRNLFKDNKKYYIGEWHTHPNGSTMYSQTDLTAMIETVDCVTVQIKNPILLIFSVSNIEINGHRFYYFKDKKLIPYE